MANKRLTNFGSLMELLNISIIDLSRALSIERTSVSRWKSGERKLSVSVPYFEHIIDYFIQRNKALGNELLEDFFDSVYPGQKRTGRNYLKSCIRDYILNLNVAKRDVDINSQSSSYLCRYTSHIGVEGRRKAVMELLDMAEKLTIPTQITLFEYNQFEWMLGDMPYLRTFYQKIKNILSMGHSIECLFAVKERGVSFLEIHKIFMELVFRDNFIIKLLSYRLNVNLETSVYIIPKKLVVWGYTPTDGSELISCTFRDSNYIAAQQGYVENLKSLAFAPIISYHQEDIEKSLETICKIGSRFEAFFCASRQLCFSTMSEELLEEILDGNKVTDEQKQRCFKLYHQLRENMEQGCANPLNGYYYVLDEITSFLSYQTMINYTLSAVVNDTVTLSRSQYLRHFKDTAELLLRDNRYRIVLHHSKVANSDTIWYRDEAWTMIVDEDESSGKIKILFGDEVKGFAMILLGFQDIYYKVSDRNKRSDYVADIFMKIADGNPGVS